MTVLTVLLLLAPAGGTTALIQWRSAVEQRNTAENAKVRAIVEALLARARP
jgi:hypothetical protein